MDENEKATSHNEDSDIEREDAPKARRPRPRKPEYANRILGRPQYGTSDDDDDE
jgi:hypothetical protein